MDESLDGVALVKALETQIKDIVPYNHDASTDLVCCGIHDGYVRLELPANGDSMSRLVEGIENAATKRVLAIAFFKQLVESGDAASIGKMRGTREEILAELAKRKESSNNPLNDIMSRIFSEEKGRDERPDKFKAFLKDLLESVTGDDENPSPDTCRAEDDSECWKCKSKSECTKFKK